MSLVDVLRCENLTKTYGHGTVPALWDVSLSIREGQVFTLLGRNGAGKTTFLKIAATQLMPTSGSICVFGDDAIRCPNEIRSRIAVVPQEARPLPPLTVWDHIYYYLRIRGYGKNEARSRSQEAMRVLEIQDFRDQRAKELSGGLKQRLLVAMAIATNAELLFLDEPTLGIDPLSRRNVWSVVSEMRKRGITIFLTTHYLDEAEALADAIVILSKGKVLVHGNLQTLTGMLAETTRIDVKSGFSEEELAGFGKVMKVGSFLRVLLDDKAGHELMSLALKRHAEIRVAPTSLDDVFVSLLGETA